MNEETYYGIQANTILTLAQIAVLLRLVDRLADQNGLRVDGVLPREWFRRELPPALRAHVEAARKLDPRGSEIVERQLFGTGHLPPAPSRPTRPPDPAP